MLQSQTNYIKRIQFKLKVYESDYQAYEDLFCRVMKHANPNFYKVEPYGNVGDEGCDGFDPDKGIYYQIYAPKTIELKKVTDKLNANFERLYLKWNTRSNTPVEEFYFVMNDKYKGTRVPLEIGLSEIDAEMKKVNSNYPTLRKTGRLLSDDLERIFFENLSEEQQMDIIGFVPNFEQQIATIKIEILATVIGSLLNSPNRNPRAFSTPENPHRDAKLKYNNLGDEIKQFLTQAEYQEHDLYDIFEQDTNQKEYLKDIFNTIYKNNCEKFKGENDYANLVFWGIQNDIMPEDKAIFFPPTLVLMSYYFKTCDIFEEPPSQTLF
jgi:hypothetical protein